MSTLETVPPMKEFRKELTALINRHSLEHGSDTPDFMLADYLVSCLEVYNQTTRQRQRWWEGRPNA